MSEFANNQDQGARQCVFRAAYFNIWRGGTQAYGLSKSADVIRLSKANVVAVQEAEGATGELAGMVGLSAPEGTDILTGFEVLRSEMMPGGSVAAIQVALPNGRTLWAVRCYVRGQAYGPYEIRRHGPDFDVEANERASGRVEAIGEAIEFIDRIAGTDDVVVMAGLNSPSHLDWTERARDRHYGLAVPWLVTREIEAAGFVDAYRAVYPDEIRKPGYTWSPGSPAPKVKKNEKHDRTDYVFFRGDALRATGCFIVGEHGSTSDIVVRPWPSDHRIVMAEFLVSV